MNSENSIKLFLQGKVHTDIFNQGKLLQNGLPLKVTFQRQRSNFALLCAAENPAFKVSFQEVIFCLRKVQLSPHKFQSILERLEKTPASYPINHVETHSVAQGLSSLNWENAILSQSFHGNVQNCCFHWIIYQKPVLV